MLVKNHGTKAGDTLLTRLRGQLDQRGTLDVLRNGIELLGLKTPLKLAEFKPALGGCSGILGLVYAVSPRLSRYSSGLRKPREILMRFSLYQRM